MATGRFFNEDGSFSEETFTIPDEQMEDTQQEYKQQAAASVSAKVDSLTGDELHALVHLCVAYVHEDQADRLIRQRRAIEGLLGPLNLGEWMALGPVVSSRMRAQNPEWATVN